MSDFQNKLLERKLRALSKKQKVKSTRDVEDSDSDSSFEVESKLVRTCQLSIDDRLIDLNNLNQVLGAKRRQIKRRVPCFNSSSDIDVPRPVKKLRK